MLVANGWCDDERVAKFVGSDGRIDKVELRMVELSGLWLSENAPRLRCCK